MTQAVVVLADAQQAHDAAKATYDAIMLNGVTSAEMAAFNDAITLTLPPRKSWHSASPRKPMRVQRPKASADAAADAQADVTAANTALTAANTALSAAQDHATAAGSAYQAALADLASAEQALAVAQSLSKASTSRAKPTRMRLPTSPRPSRSWTTGRLP